MREKSSRGVGLRHYVSKLDRDGTSRIRVGPSALIERGGRLGEMGHKNLWSLLLFSAYKDSYLDPCRFWAHISAHVYTGLISRTCSTPNVLYNAILGLCFVQVWNAENFTRAFQRSVQFSFQKKRISFNFRWIYPMVQKRPKNRSRILTSSDNWNISLQFAICNFVQLSCSE